MAEFTMTVPEGLEKSLELTGEQLSSHIRLMAALKMFELGQVSSAKAAELAGLDRIEFFDACGRYRISIFNYPPESARAEIASDLAT